MMLTYPNTPTFLAEAAPAASIMPCWHGVDAKRRSGDAIALARRHVR
jgi:hypothetical protein